MNILRALVAVASIILSGALIAAEHYIMTTVGVCSIPSCAPGSPPAWDSGAWVESRLLGYPYVVGMRNSHTVYEDNVTVVGWSGYAEGYWTDWHDYRYGGPEPVTATTPTWIPQPDLRRRIFRPRTHGANAGRLEEAAAEWKTTKGIVRSC
ncbi:MAG TPA: hypothetical protein VF215_17175 [Thermoanaerobaculia bacterium]